MHSTTTIQNFFGLGEEQSHKTETVFDADHPAVFAAEDNGITPIEYLLVGLASCLTAGVASVAQNRGIQLRSVEATVEGNHDIRGILGDTDVRNGFNDIKVNFKIDADASDQEIEALVAQSQKRSAVFDALTNPTEVTVASAEDRAIEGFTAVVIGAGHAGLAASHFLGQRSIDHVVLERGEPANSWRSERWDSLRLLTPNWQSRLPAGVGYEGDDADGYMTAADVVDLIERFAASTRAPVRTQTNVTSVSQMDDGYRVTTSQGEIRAQAVVIASGACNRPVVAGFADAIPRSVQQLTAFATATPTSSPPVACWSSGRRRPACSWPPSCSDRGARSPSRWESTSGCRAPIAGATSCGGWMPPASGTNATTRSKTSHARGGCPRRSSSGLPSGRRSTSTR